MNSRESGGRSEEKKIAQPEKIKLSGDEEERNQRQQLVNKILDVWRKKPAGVSAFGFPSHIYLDTIGVSLARGESPVWEHVRHDIKSKLDAQGSKIDDVVLENAWEYMRDFAETGGNNNLKTLREKLAGLKAEKETLEKYVCMPDAGPESRAKDGALIEEIQKKMEVLSSEIKIIEEHKY